MKSFVNTAKIEYLWDGETKQLTSNEVVVSIMLPSRFVSGEVICRKSCGKWWVEIYEKNSSRRIFCLNGYVSKGFYAQIKPQRQYYIKFTGDRNSTMRLYNIPDSVSLYYDCI